MQDGEEADVKDGVMLGGLEEENRRGVFFFFKRKTAYEMA